MKSKKYYTVYKIINRINNKIYIGAHITSNLNDDYMGSGKNIKRAIKKYGIENFKKEYLYVFENKESMFEMEAILVNEEFINEDNTYNIKLGGYGGWDYINNNRLNTNNKEFYKKIGGWKDLEKRRKVWNSVSIDFRKSNAKKMGEKYGGNNKLSHIEISERLDLIKDIDLTKYGWVKKVSEILDISHTQTKRFIDKYYIGDVYRRK